MANTLPPYIVRSMRLRDAAEDMLKALKHVVYVHGVPKAFDGEMRAMMVAVHAAIAKAEGRE